MRQRKLDAQEIVEALHAFGTGMPVPEICTRWEISTATLYEWRRHYAGMSTAAITQFQQLVHENAHLRRRVSGLELDCSVFQAAMQYQRLSPEQRRELIRWLRKQLRVSLARVCRLMGMSRSLFGYGCLIDCTDTMSPLKDTDR